VRDYESLRTVTVVCFRKSMPGSPSTHAVCLTVHRLGLVDLAEYETFLGAATRDAVKEVLRVKIAETRVKVSQRQEQLRVIAAAKEAAAAASSPAIGLPSPSGPIYEPINSFSWADVRYPLPV
jgi:hypothetical protein